jgi:hypothetical protein
MGKPSRVAPRSQASHHPLGLLERHPVVGQAIADRDAAGSVG